MKMAEHRISPKVTVEGIPELMSMKEATEACLGMLKPSRRSLVRALQLLGKGGSHNSSGERLPFFKIIIQTKLSDEWILSFPICFYDLTCAACAPHQYQMNVCYTLLYLLEQRTTACFLKFYVLSGRVCGCYEDIANCLKSWSWTLNQALYC